MTFDDEKILCRRPEGAAHIRHAETPYDELLAESYDLQDARDEVLGEIEKVLTAWQGT